MKQQWFHQFQPAQLSPPPPTPSRHCWAFDNFSCLRVGQGIGYYHSRSTQGTVWQCEFSFKRHTFFVVNLTCLNCPKSKIFKNDKLIAWVLCISCVRASTPHVQKFVCTCEVRRMSGLGINGATRNSIRQQDETNIVKYSHKTYLSFVLIVQRRLDSKSLLDQTKK